MKKAPTIILTGGGSGGHILPLLSLARALKSAAKDSKIVYIGQKGEKTAAGLRSQFDIFDVIYSVPAGKFRRYHGESLLSHLADVKTVALNTRDLFRVIGGVGYSLKILKRVKPDVVFSKGGFVAVPVGLAASRLRIPIVTHDSDTLPGLANRIVGRFAKAHAVGMSSSHYKYPEQNTHYVGIPIDEKIKPITSALQANFKKDLGLPSDSLVLLVSGGGLGARDVNNIVVGAAQELLEHFSKLHIVHITGENHNEQVHAAYNAAVKSGRQRIKVYGFVLDFYKYSGAADLVICRAGATTLAELAAQQKAVIVIPAPHLSGGHQSKNAQQLEENQAAVVVTNDASPEQLLKVVTELLRNRDKRQLLAGNLAKLAKPRAAQDLAKIVLDVAGHK